MPVVVRIRRQPPINPVWILVAIGLAASGLFLPLVAALRAMIIVGAVVALVVGLMSRLFLRVPPGSVGLVVKGGRQDRVLQPGVHRVSPLVALSHLVTTREIAFDVPVSEVRSADGVGVAVDVLLTLRIADPVKFAYAITPGDADQFVQAACQDAVRTLVRGIEAMSALDLNSTQSDSLRQVIDPKLDRFGIDVSDVAFTRVTLPAALTDSLEARRLASLQLAEQAESYALDKRRLADQAALVVPGGRVPAVRRRVRGRRRGAPPGDARGADRGQPERRSLRPGDLADPRGPAARRQQPGRGVAGGDGPHVEPARGARGRGRERRGRCGRCRRRRRHRRRRSHAGLSDPVTDAPEPGETAEPGADSARSTEAPEPAPGRSSRSSPGHRASRPAARLGSPAFGPLVPLAAIVLVLVGALALREVATIVVPVVFGLFLALVAWPMVGVLERRGARHAIALTAALMVVLAIVLVAGGILALSVAELVLQVPKYEGRLRDQIEMLQDLLAQFGITHGPGRPPGAHQAGADPVDRPPGRVRPVRGRPHDLRPHVHDDLRAVRGVVAPGAGAADVRRASTP